MLRWRSDELERRIKETEIKKLKLEQENNYLAEKVKLNKEKLEEAMNNLQDISGKKEEIEKKFKSTVDQLQENYKMMSDAYIKERDEKDNLANQIYNNKVRIENDRSNQNKTNVSGSRNIN